MRLLAVDLDVGTMTLYHYVHTARPPGDHLVLDPVAWLDRSWLARQFQDCDRTGATVDLDECTIGDTPSGVGHRRHTRNTELTTDDHGVALGCADIDHYACGRHE